MSTNDEDEGLTTQFVRDDEPAITACERER